MRPLFDPKDELIKHMGDASWESIPERLEQNLVEIPAKMTQRQSLLYEKATLILNIILSLWVLSSIFIFREYWTPLVSRLSENIAFSMLPPYPWLSHPMVILLFLGVSCFGFLWSDMDRNRTMMNQ